MWEKSWYDALMKGLPPAKIKNFQDKILHFYQDHGREHLPWRKDRNPYRIFVSEIMLQQTQADRVIPKFTEFIKAVPTIEKLAKLPQKKLLRLWQGLGYNSRALRMQRAAREIVVNHAGKIHKDKEALIALPSIGPYTASAIRVFAHNLPDIVIETNIRRIFIHEFFKDRENISDADILPLIEQTLPKENPRIWYEALMDYGATLPKVLKRNPNTRSLHYTKQSKFVGSDRELRGKILRLTLAGKKWNPETLGEKPERIQRILKGLKKDGFKL